MQPQADPERPEVAASYAPLFRNCDTTAASSLMAFNVTQECRVSWYVLGDPGPSAEQPCSQNAESNSIAAYYTAPNIVAAVDSPGLMGFDAGVSAVLGASGLDVTLFATAQGKAIPDAIAATTTLTLGLPATGYSYLGGGDNGQGLNSGVRGVNQGSCPAGE